MPDLRALILVGAVTATFFLAPTDASGQETPDPVGVWNSPRALELLELGRGARRQLADDGSLESYRALTEGHIYFHVDPEEGERALIRVDQIAVELYWEAPDLVRQHIVGERAETRLPVRDFRYYLDRLTLVQYGFGDEIEIGHGMDVAGVPHPLASRAGLDPEREPYDVRILSTVELQLPGEPEPLRVHEIEIRPRNPARPGVLGSIHLNDADGQLVRMAITFTPSSYVDPRIDRIRVELDYGRWEGRYWLPNRQEIEVRREVPELDFGIGTVIRAVLRVSEYELNAPFPSLLRTAPPVTRAHDEDRGAYSFREGLFDAMERDGMGQVATRVDPRELRAEAARLLQGRPPTGLSPIRFHLPNASSVFRADRARGVTVGAGTSIRPMGTLRLRAWGGWSIASGRPAASVDVDGITGGDWTLRLGATLNEAVDLGARPGAPPLFSTGGALFLGEDYLDPYRRNTVGISVARLTPDGTRVEFGAGFERHRSDEILWTTPPLGGSTAFRPLPTITEGNFAALRGTALHRFEALGFGGWGGGTGATLVLRGDAELLAGSPGVGARIEAEAEVVRRPVDGSRELRASVAAGTRTGDALPQHERLFGGRGTVSGFPYRSTGGAIWTIASLSAATDIRSPWLRLRTGLESGWAHETDGVLIGARAGIGFAFDILRIDLARGLIGGGAEWQLILGVDPLWWNRM